MGNVLKVLKINMLALVALPLLVIAIIAKLLARAVEKLHIILGAIGILIVGIILYMIIKEPGYILTIIGLVIILMLFVGLILGVFILFFALILGAYLGIVSIFSMLMEGVHHIAYGCYMALYDTCKKDYQSLMNEGNKMGYSVAVIGWWILKSITWLLTYITSKAFVISSIVSVGIVGAALFKWMQVVREHFGISLFEFWGLFNKIDLVMNSILLAVILGSVILIIQILGIEWSEWGKETYLAIQDYEKYLELIEAKSQGVDCQSIADKESIVVGEVEKQASAQTKLDASIELLNDQLEAFDVFDEQIRAYLEMTNNMLLSEEYMKYIHQMEIIVGEINQTKGFSIPQAQEWCLKVKRLSGLRRNLEKMLLKNMAKQQQEQKQEQKQFFEGCDTPEARDKRYKALCKVYHPDTATGNEAVFKTLQQEYESLSD